MISNLISIFSFNVKYSQLNANMELKNNSCERTTILLLKLNRSFGTVVADPGSFPGTVKSDTESPPLQRFFGAVLPRR